MALVGGKIQIRTIYHLRYDRVFSIIDIKESNIQKWGDSLPFYRNVKKEGIVLWKAA